MRMENILRIKTYTGLGESYGEDKSLSTNYIQCTLYYVESIKPEQKPGSWGAGEKIPFLNVNIKHLLNYEMQYCMSEEI